MVVNMNVFDNQTCLTCWSPLDMRRPVNKKVFPVYRPGGSKRADWNFFFHLFKKSFFFLLPPLYILVKKN